MSTLLTPSLVWYPLAISHFCAAVTYHPSTRLVLDGFVRVVIAWITEPTNTVQNFDNVEMRMVLVSVDDCKIMKSITCSLSVVLVFIFSFALFCASEGLHPSRLYKWEVGESRVLVALLHSPWFCYLLLLLSPVCVFLLLLTGRPHEYRLRGNLTDSVHCTSLDARLIVLLRVFAKLALRRRLIVKGSWHIYSSFLLRPCCRLLPQRD